jgi:hypothetical protein
MINALPGTSNEASETARLMNSAIETQRIHIKVWNHSPNILILQTLFLKIGEQSVATPLELGPDGGVVGFPVAIIVAVFEGVKQVTGFVVFDVDHGLCLSV